jgi:hypothetical protein
VGWGLGDTWRVHEVAVLWTTAVGAYLADWHRRDNDTRKSVFGCVVVAGVCRNRNVVERHQMCAKLNEQLREYKRAHGCVVPVCAPFFSCLTWISQQLQQFPLVLRFRLRRLFG